MIQTLVETSTTVIAITTNTDQYSAFLKTRLTIASTCDSFDEIIRYQRLPMMFTGTIVIMRGWRWTRPNWYGCSMSIVTAFSLARALWARSRMFGSSACRALMPTSCGSDDTM